MWSTEERTAFANDLGEPWELAAVSGSSNFEKADKDPADWLPPLASDVCSYLGDYLATKARWDLAVDQRERRALIDEVSGCAGVERPYEPAA